MKQKTFERAEAERLAPLIRSVGTEIRDRTQAIARLTERLEALQPDAGRHGPEIGSLRSDLSRHLRRLTKVRKEVEQLGLWMDEAQPLRIVVPCADGDWIYDGRLDGTNFYQLESAPV